MKMKTRYYEFKSLKKASISKDINLIIEDKELFLKELTGLMCEIGMIGLKETIGFYYKSTSKQFFFVWKYED